MVYTWRWNKWKNINKQDLEKLQSSDNEVTERLMNMMEKFTKRIVKLENKFEIMINEKWKGGKQKWRFGEKINYEKNTLIKKIMKIKEKS